MERQQLRVLPLPLTMIIATVLAAAAAALFMSARSAHAEISGPCEATINGQDVRPRDSGNRDDDIDVSQNTAVPVGATSATGFRSHKVQLEFAGRRWTVSEEEDDGSLTWSDTVNVDDYATYGVGLYKVVGVSTLMDGTTCTGAATVDVSGNPLTTVAGGAATAAVVAGTVGAGISFARGASATPSAMDPAERVVNEMERLAQQGETPEQARRRREDELREIATRPDTPNAGFLAWLFNISPLSCLTLSVIALLMLPFMAIAGGEAGGAGEPPRAPATTAAPEPPGRLPRAPWRARVSLLGLVCGLLAGAGIVVLLQQYSIAYPTQNLVIACVLIGMAAYGIVLPTLGSTIKWLRLNQRVVAQERRLGIG